MNRNIFRLSIRGRFPLAVLLCAGFTLSVSTGCTSLFRSGSQKPGQFHADLGPLPDAIAQPVQTALEPTARFFSNAGKAIQPSHDRDWRPSMAILPYAEFRDRTVLVRNVRNCTFETNADYELDYYDRSYSIDEVQTLDVFVMPFASSPSVAHIAMSFGFENGDYLGVSVEVRKEDHETYDPVAGVLRQYELIYILADERDMVRRSTDQVLTDVYRYRLNVTPGQAQRAFLDVMNRTNDLIRDPEFYNTVTNNCTTNVIDHLNVMLPKSQHLPRNYQIVFSGHMDKSLYDRGLIASDQPFGPTKRAARINWEAYLYSDSENFSEAIRGELDEEAGELAAMTP